MTTRTHPIAAEVSHSRATLRSWLLHVTILLFSFAAGVSFIYFITEPKAKPTQAIYSIFLIQSETPIADFQNEARAVLTGAVPVAPAQTTWSIQGNLKMMTSFGAPATFSLQIPDSLSGSMRLEQLTVDLTATEARKGVRTKFGFLKGAARSEHQFELETGDLRVIELSKGNAPVHGYYYALVQVEAVDPTPASTALGIPRPVTVPSTGMSK